MSGAFLKLEGRGFRVAEPKAPPLIHMTAYVTGGLAELYQQIAKDKIPLIHEYGSYTDNKGCFIPQSNMSLLASRYRLVQALGQGQSSILFKAQDTFNDNGLVALKVLNTGYTALGAQESECIRQLNKADPHHVSSTLLLLNTFQMDDHFCMVFEVLDPAPISTYFKSLKENQKLPGIRKVALKLLQSLGFLRRQNVIHADLKPENILLKQGTSLESLRLVDFGNSIHCVHDEVSLYYDDFELQTLLYRAPEVMFGLPFGPEIDMWSLGLVLLELYTGQPLYIGKDKEAIMTQMYNILGPFPKDLFQRGKFFPRFQGFSGRSPQRDATQHIVQYVRATSTPVDYSFANFIAIMLRYDCNERATPCQAARHIFLAPEVAVLYLLPMPDEVEDQYPVCAVSGSNYKSGPSIDESIRREHLDSVRLLRRGTTDETQLKIQQLGSIPEQHFVKSESVESNCIKVLPQYQPPHAKNVLLEVVEMIRQEEDRIDISTDPQVTCQQLPDTTVVSNSIASKNKKRKKKESCVFSATADSTCDLSHKRSCVQFDGKIDNHVTGSDNHVTGSDVDEMPATIQWDNSAEKIVSRRHTPGGADVKTEQEVEEIVNLVDFSPTRGNEMENILEGTYTISKEDNPVSGLKVLDAWSVEHIRPITPKPNLDSKQVTIPNICDNDKAFSMQSKIAGVADDNNFNGDASFNISSTCTTPVLREYSLFTEEPQLTTPRNATQAFTPRTCDRMLLGRPQRVKNMQCVRGNSSESSYVGETSATLEESSNEVLSTSSSEKSSRPFKNKNISKAGTKNIKFADICSFDYNNSGIGPNNTPSKKQTMSAAETPVGWQKPSSSEETANGTATNVTASSSSLKKTLFDGQSSDSDSLSLRRSKRTSETKNYSEIGNCKYFCSMCGFDSTKILTARKHWRDAHLLGDWRTTKPVIIVQRSSIHLDIFRCPVCRFSADTETNVLDHVNESHKSMMNEFE